MIENKKLIGVPDLAEWLGASPGNVYKEYRSLGIPYIRVGGRLRFRVEAVEEWLAEQEALTTTGATVE